MNLQLEEILKDHNRRIQLFGITNPDIETDNRNAELDVNGNIIIKSTNPKLIKDNRSGNYTEIPIFI